MVKNREINGTEEIALVTPTPGVHTLSIQVILMKLMDAVLLFQITT